MDSPDPVVATDRAGKVLARLHAASLRARRFLVLRGGVRLAAAGVVAAFATLGLDLWLRPGLPMRGSIGVLLLGALAFICWRVVIDPAKLRLRPLDVARVWDLAARRHGDRLVQAVGTLAGIRASDDLAIAARERACDDLEAFDFDASLDVAGARRRIAALVALLSVPIACSVLAPSVAGTWARRWLFGSNEPWPQDTWLEIADLRDGRLVVAAREPFTLRVSARAGTVTPDAVDLEFVLDGSEARVIPMTHAQPNTFTAELPAVMSKGTLWLRGGDDHVGPVSLIVRERPEIESFELQALVPGGTTPSTRRFTLQEEDLRFLEGTRLTLDVLVNEDAAGIMTTGNEIPPFEPEARGSRRFRLEWTHDRAVSFSVSVDSTLTRLRSHQRNLAIEVFRDTAPRVQLDCLGIGDRVTPSARIPCRLDALDDIGIASARLSLGTLPGQADSSPARAFEAPVVLGDQAGTAHVIAEHALELRDLGVVAGQRVRVLATAKDRRHPEPQEGRSRARDLTVVPPEVLLAEIVSRLQAARARFRTALSDERAFRERLEAPLLPAAVSDLSKRFRMAERTLSSVRRAVDDGVREMSLNRVLEEEGVTLLEKTVLEPFAELERGLLREQREAIEAAIGDGLQKGAAEAAHERQVRVIAALEGILKGMDRWDTLVDLIAQLGEVIRLQTDVRKDTQTGGVESKRVLRDK